MVVGLTNRLSAVIIKQPINYFTMRHLITTSAKLISIIAFVLVSTQVSASEVELRFSKANFNESTQELFVDVEVQYTLNGQLSLAGQNYRFFYSSEVLEFDADATTSLLSEKNYTSISVDNHKSGVKADKVNQLSFDNDLGFVNLSIDLHDLKNGGLVLTENDGWVTVARLKFDVKKEGAAYDIVWGREGVSELYATAFVEMGEWVSASKLDKLTVSYYGDLSSQDKSEAILAVADVTVGPNPTADFINITLETELQDAATIVLRDMTGRTVQTKVMTEGSISYRVDLSQLGSANYMLEMIDANHNKLYNTQVVVAK